MEEEQTKEEREQAIKFNAFKKISLGILGGWAKLLVCVFLLLSVSFSTFIVWKMAKSRSRFDAVTRLLFMPRQVSNIHNITDKQLLSILERASLKRRVGMTLAMDDVERECLSMDLTIIQERKPSNLYTLKARASSWVGAIRKVNAYAEVLVSEYVSYRMKELNLLAEAIELRRNNIREMIATVEAEESVLKGKAGEASPVEALTMLNSLLSDQRRNHSMLTVQIANEEVRRKRLQDEVGEVGPAIIKCAPQIRKKSAELAAIDEELVKLREIYTDINPKVIGKIEDRRALMKEYAEILNENGIQGVALDDIERMEQAALELADSQLKLEVLEENRRSLEAEIKNSEMKSETLTGIIAPLERLRVKREELEKSFREQDLQLGNIEYLRMTTRNDLQQIERAGGAGDKNPFSPKNFLMAVGGATACTIGLAIWILLLEMSFGKLRGGDELTAYEDVELIGSLPKPGSVSEGIEKDVMGVVALNFCNSVLPRNIVLVCRLPGAQPQERFASVLEWSLSMAGQRFFDMNIVPAVDFEPPEDAETMVNTIRKENKGWFPVANRFVFSPTEQQMLKADFEMLRGDDYDRIFVRVPEGLRHGGNFLGNLMSLCDSVLLVVGAGTTPRSEVAYFRKVANAAGKPIMGLVAGARAKVVKKEMEAAS